MGIFTSPLNLIGDGLIKNVVLVSLNYHIHEGGLLINNTTLCSFLGIDHAHIKTIDQVSKDNRTYIFITLKSSQEECPYCSSSHVVSKGFVKRKINHALFINKETTIELIIKRYECKECGKSFVSKQSFASKRSRLSYDTVKTILDALRKYTCTFEHAGKIAHVSNTTAKNVFDQYVNPKRKRLPKVLAIDEVYNKGQFSAAYSCVFFDFLGSKIVDVIQDRSKASLSRYLTKISRKERQEVKYVVIDMWEPYVDIANYFFENAIIVIDSFHVIKEMNAALDDLRCKIMSRFEPGTIEYYLLKKQHELLFKSHHVWKEKEYNPRLKMMVNEYDVVKMMLSLDNELKTAYEYCSKYRTFNSQATYENAQRLFDEFSMNIEIAKIEEFRPIIRMLQNWEEYILNSFLIVEGRRLSNGPIEGCNSQIKKLMRISNGLEHPIRFRNRLMHCYNNEAVMSPVKEKIPKIKRKPRGNYKKPPRIES